MRVKIDPRKCQGHNRCRALAPQLFDVDELGYGVVKREDVPEGLEQLASLAVSSCPENAISTHDDLMLDETRPNPSVREQPQDAGEGDAPAG